MAKYKYNPYRSSEGREAINQNCLDNMTGKVSNLGWSVERIQEAIFNRYTGIGGLSGVQFGDHANFAEYTRAKQEIEMGQFFTPPNVISEMLQSLTVRPEDKVIDPTCGMGNFFNFMPEEHNCYGVELDVQAYNVCRFLYPKANILDGSMLDKPFKKASFDIALCNPPFNLKWTYNKEVNSSQNVFLWKLAEWLKPGAVVVFVCPFHWLEDSFFFKSTIERIAGLYSYIGGYKLPDYVRDFLKPAGRGESYLDWYKKMSEESKKGFIAF